MALFTGGTKVSMIAGGAGSQGAVILGTVVEEAKDGSIRYVDLTDACICWPYLQVNEYRVRKEIICGSIRVFLDRIWCFWVRT